MNYHITTPFISLQILANFYYFIIHLTLHEAPAGAAPVTYFEGDRNFKKSKAQHLSK